MFFNNLPPTDLENLPELIKSGEDLMFILTQVKTRLSCHNFEMDKITSGYSDPLRLRQIPLDSSVIFCGCEVEKC